MIERARRHARKKQGLLSGILDTLMMKPETGDCLQVYLLYIVN